MHFRFLTSTPLNVVQGSGTFAGITTLAKFLTKSGATVEFVTPKLHLPIYTAERIIFNQTQRWHQPRQNAITVGFDMDGYTVANRGFHIASIKGVIADEMRFETGLTRATMRLQAHCEKLNVQRSSLIVAPSRYSARRIQELYGIAQEPCVIPESIDLQEWQSLLASSPARTDSTKFVVLTVCRFYPRKRLHLLLRAAKLLQSRIPNLEIRIVGDGPEAARLKSLCRDLALGETVIWLGNADSAQLAGEYKSCNVFCLPSVQESFGIVYLEAMASGRPIVAARAASAPEVVKHGILVDPENHKALAEGIEQLYRKPALRDELANAGSQCVQNFDGPVVAAQFMRAVESAVTASSTRVAASPIIVR